MGALVLAELARRLDALETQLERLQAQERMDDFHLLDAPLTHASWDGDAKTVGDYAIDTSAWGCPVAVRAVLVRVLAKWASASDGSHMGCQRLSSDTHDSVAVWAQEAGVKGENMGIVPCDSNGDFNVQIGGANATAVWLQIWGWRR